jgi:hypothetical protein
LIWIKAKGEQRFFFLKNPRIGNPKNPNTHHKFTSFMGLFQLCAKFIIS